MLSFHFTIVTIIFGLKHCAKILHLHLCFRIMMYLNKVTIAIKI